MPALCQSEAILFKQMAYFPQQLPIQSQKQGPQNGSSCTGVAVQITVGLHD